MEFSFSGSLLNTITQGGTATFRITGLLSGGGATSMGNVPFSQRFDASQVVNLQGGGDAAPKISSSECEAAIVGG